MLVGWLIDWLNYSFNVKCTIDCRNQNWAQDPTWTVKSMTFWRFSCLKWLLISLHCVRNCFTDLVFDWFFYFFFVQSVCKAVLQCDVRLCFQSEQDSPFNTSAGRKTGTFVFWRSSFQSEWEAVKTLGPVSEREPTSAQQVTLPWKQLPLWNCGLVLVSILLGVVFPPFLWLQERFTECGTSEHGAVLSLAPDCAWNIPSICAYC